MQGMEGLSIASALNWPSCPLTYHCLKVLKRTCASLQVLLPMCTSFWSSFCCCPTNSAFFRRSLLHSRQSDLFNRACSRAYTQTRACSSWTCFNIFGPSQHNDAQHCSISFVSYCNTQHELHLAHKHAGFQAENSCASVH